MAETSLYRRHRPQSFDEVVGQEHVVRTLRNAVENDRVHHAYLFVGSRGTGKTSLAKILARSLNCVNGPTVTPCGECESCRTIAAGSSLDVIEMDAASNRSVDDIRDLRERVSYAPAQGNWKVYILDEAHMLTREAWNAFLKTLEEPPPNTVFVLCTTEPHKVMPTIVDRCQRFDFQRPSLEQIANVVRRVAAAESIEIDDGAVAAIARAAGGSFRDALGTLDQLVAYCGKRVATDDVLAVLGVAEAELILAAADAMAAEDGRAAFEVSERVSRSGRDVTQFGRDVLAHLRQLLVIRTVGEVPDAFSVTAADPQRLRAQADELSELALMRAIDVIAAALAAVKEGDEPRMTLELALLRAARPQLDPTKQALLQRVERLESSFGRGDPQPPEHSVDSPSAPDTDAISGSDEAPSAQAEAGPARAAAAVVEEPAERVDFERVVSLWPAVVDRVRESGFELLSTFFAAARPVALDMDGPAPSLKIGFPPSAAFNKRKAETQEARECLAEAVRTIVGERLRPVYVLLDADEAAAAIGGDSELSEEELIAKLKAEFDAEEFDEAEDLDAEEEAAR
ncbi:MAG TPA: DNA polymerase III subunit gamma/tau [Solirubrobacterales bacterium]|nr:DNA polymerase III subunit gamma/tau [Solirubrobacterales bacterium]